MPSTLYFSPAFKPSLSLSTLLSSPRESSKKRKRDLEPLDENDVDDGDEGSEANSTDNGVISSSSPYIATSSAAIDVKNSYGDNALHFHFLNCVDHERSHASKVSRSLPHHIKETVSSMVEEQISDELAILKPPLYVAVGRLPAATLDKTSGSMGLRQHHLNTITAVLHRCLSECDYIRAGRAWAMLLRAEQRGQSMDLRTHGRWGVGAEILVQRETQMTQKSLYDRDVEASNPSSNLRIKPESIKKAKEYYERVVLQYPYRKAFPKVIGALNFSIAMFSLWVYAVKEGSSIALMSVGSSNENIDETDAGANDSVRRSSASHIEPGRYRMLEQVKRDTLKKAHEIAAQLIGLLASPPYSDNAKLWKLYGEISLWIADLSIAAVFSSSDHKSSINGDDEDLPAERSSLSRDASRNTSLSKEYRAGQERQNALAKAKEAFRMVKMCGESLAE